MKFLKYITIFIILSIFLQTENILATCVTSSYRCNGASDDFIVHPTQITETINGKTYKTYVMQRQYSEKYVYCLQKGLDAPHVAYGLTDPNYCTSNNFVGENVRAAIGYVINTNYDYVAKQHVIHKLMADAGYGSNPVTYNTTLYNAATSIRDSYNATPTVTLGNFTLNGNNYEASYSISGATGLGNPTVSVNVGSVSNGKVYIPINTSTSNGQVNVTITISYSKSYALAITKTCGKYQPIAEQDTTAKSKSYSDSDSKTVSITGGLKVTKTNSNNDALAQLDSTTTVKFKLYNNSSCTGTALKDFNAGDTVSNLTPGTYYLKEYQTKKGYHLPQSGEKWYCEPVTVTAGQTNTISVTNQTACEFEFNSSMTMKSRIELYNRLKTAYSQNFNALLDMNNTTASTACKNIPVTNAYTKGCLSATSFSDYSSNFSDTNVSMYTEKYGTYTFCVTSYKMENKLGKSTFDDIKTGQSIISTDNVVAIGTINRECYNFGDNENVIPDLKSDNYIENDATIDGVDLIKTESLTGIKTNQALSTQYTLPIMYASNKDGKVYYGYCPSGEYCKVLGRGIVSKFNLKPGTYDLKFDIKLKKDKFGDLGPNSDCRYTVENELIDFNNKLSIEFRPVNTDSDALFLGKDGTSDRKIGANWSSKDDREFVLKEKNNSYNKNNEEPLYKITLTPEITKEIRKNNKNKTYDDYNMTCVEDGTICISNYLTCLQDRKILFIRERKNIDKFKANQIVCKY